MPASKRVAGHGKATRQGWVAGDFPAPDIPDYVVTELRYEAPVAYTSSRFTAPGDYAAQADSLNETLARFRIKRVRSQLGLAAAAVRSRVGVAATLPPEPHPSRHADRGVDTGFVHSGFVQIEPERGRDASRLAKALERDPAVWSAYVAPRPVPAAVRPASSGSSHNFEPTQGYLHAPPNGIGAAAVWDVKGGRGGGVTICDIEGNWNRGHEDLPARIKRLGGTFIDDPHLEWRNHGTAVLGEMVSRPDTKGTVGVCHNAKAVVHSAVINGVFNTAGAITAAAAALSAGDVILIELQAVGPNDKYVAMQFWPDVFSAIVAATAKGITVVEAAGNGDENFQLAVFKGTGLQKDSGAIVVGAGVPPTSYFDNDGGYESIGVPRSRIWFSNYGSIVNVQGWGWHVTTLGYGDAQGGSQRAWYTHRFSGTSSASPIVTGAVACLQGRAKAKKGAPLAPSKVRQILVQTGTPQAAGPRVPLSQHIGPQPDLTKAFKRV